MSLYQFKKHKRKNFTTVDNTFINDSNLNWKAKGILLYLLSRPDDWQVYIKDLVNKAADGEKALRSGLNELEKHGYLARFVERDEKGRFIKTLYQIFENPEDNICFLQSMEEIENNERPVNRESHPHPQNGKMDRNPTNHPLSQNRQVDNRQVDNRHADNDALLNTEYTKERNIQNTHSTKKGEARKREQSFKNFKKFRQFLIDNYAGIFKTTLNKESNLGYLPTTVIMLKENGYLYNSASDSYLDKDEAMKVWSYLFEKQEKVMQRLAQQ